MIQIKKTYAHSRQRGGVGRGGVFRGVRIILWKETITRVACRRRCRVTFIPWLSPGTVGDKIASVCFWPKIVGSTAATTCSLLQRLAVTDSAILSYGTRPPKARSAARVSASLPKVIECLCNLRFAKGEPVRRRFGSMPNHFSTRKPHSNAIMHQHVKRCMELCPRPPEKDLGARVGLAHGESPFSDHCGVGQLPYDHGRAV